MNRSTNLFSRNHLILCFWFRREGGQMPNVKQLLYQTEKRSHRRFSMKKLFLKIFAILTGKHLCEIFKNICFEEHLRTTAFELTLCSDSLELCFWTVFKMILTRWYYKNTSCFQTKALNKIWRICRLLCLSPMLSCEPRFCMFIINGYCTKSKLL